MNAAVNSAATPRLGIVLSTVTDASPQTLVELGQHAEARGFDAVYVNEGRGDAMASALAIALATERITVGTNIANIYFRHPFLAAQTARTIAELTAGRFVLGLGMSHRGMLKLLGIDMGNAREYLRDYTERVVAALAGDAGAGFLAPPPTRYPVPVFVAGNTVESAAVAGATGDGLMPYLTPVSHLPTLLAAAREANDARTEPAAPFGCILSMPTFVSDDEDAARSAARYNLAFFAQLPNYRRQWRRAGYGAVMDAARDMYQSGKHRRDVAAGIPDQLIEDVCVFGNVAQCRRQLDAFRAAGVDEPVLAVSPVNEGRDEATARAIEALAPA